MACGEAACGRSEAEPLAALRGVTPEQVARWVGGVPEGKEHCPVLVSRALAQAMRVPQDPGI